MKLTLLRPFLVVLLFSGFFPLIGTSQNLTGIWRGRFITDNGDEYKYELQIDQSKKNHISGVSYSYLDTRFYGKAILTGNFVKTAGSALVQEVKTVEIKMAGGSTACIMKCLFTHAISGKEEFLEGTFTSSYEKSDPAFGVQRGGNCGGGKVYLRKVTSSDFYIEPFLRSRPIIEKKDSIVAKPPVSIKKKVPAKKILSRPTVKASPKPLDKKPSVKKHSFKRDSLFNNIRHDTIANRKTTGPVIIDKVINNPEFNIPITTRSRENELVQTITVNNEDIVVRLYDNGEVDDDTVSVYMDGKPLAMNKRLSTIPITLSIKMDENTSEHTLIMYAENMGRIPPNTSLMIVQDGDKRYQVSIVSTEQKNAMVRFRYKKKQE